jgi:hypothetical protein
MPAVLPNGTILLRTVDPDTGYVVTRYLAPRTFEEVGQPAFHLQRRMPLAQRDASEPSAGFADDEYDQPCP